MNRMFSQARQANVKTYILEYIEPEGAIADEIKELKANHQYKNICIMRISFWLKLIKNESRLQLKTSEDLYGYFIYKLDEVDGKTKGHIFESVIRKYDHIHNFLPGNKKFNVKIIDKTFQISGIMYCQQNAKNKICAHVALRSILSGIVPNNDICFSEISKYALTYKYGKPFSVEQIQNVLGEYCIKYEVLTKDGFKKAKEKFQLSHKINLPLTRFIYTGIENGLGYLVIFYCPRANEYHIIPLFGHTFNQDTWAPRATSYFETVKYNSSEEWVSSFIAHDDNMGSNLCIPKSYFDSQGRDVACMIELFPEHIEYNGVIAELYAYDLLDILIYRKLLEVDSNFWVNKFLTHSVLNNTNNIDIVLRPILITKQKYYDHLRFSKDWNKNKEDKNIAKKIKDLVPDTLWMIEVSISDLFSTNYRKIGEIILDPSIPEIKHDKKPPFVLARFPEMYFVHSSSGMKSVKSQFTSHIQVYSNSKELRKLKF